jgi:hypothetical protein
MTDPDTQSGDDAPSSVTVRAAAGQLRIVPVWQALGQHAAHAKRTRLHLSEKHNFDEMTISFESVPPGDLAEIVERLRTQPWVVAATLQTAQASFPNVDHKLLPGGERSP